MLIFFLLYLLQKRKFFAIKSIQYFVETIMQRPEFNLLDQLNKLILIDDLVPIEKNFILGYILKNSTNINPQTIKQLIRAIELILELNHGEMITKIHVFELIVVFSLVCENLHQHKITSLIDFYEHSVEEIINDNDYLKNKYFHHSASSIKKQHKMQKSKIIPPISELMEMDMERVKSDIAQCTVCLVKIQLHNICALGCGHIIHKECFQQCMKVSILDKKFPLKCPFEECKNYIQTLDIEEYLPKQLIEKYYEFTLHNYVEKNTKNMTWCPTAGCSYAFQFTGNITNYACTKCMKSYCLKCKTQAHYDKTCEQNQSIRSMSAQDKQFIEFAKGAKYKQCPECKFWVQKNHGCCHMTCRCGYEFCYVCGKKHGECNCESQYENYYGSQDSQQNSEMDNDEMEEDDAISSQIERMYNEQSANLQQKD